jgi:hypothetical protein
VEQEFSKRRKAPAPAQIAETASNRVRIRFDSPHGILKQALGVAIAN